MQVSVETLSGLERKLTVVLPFQKIEEEVETRLKSLAKKVKMDGYRPGKVPLPAVKSRYMGSVRGEVLQDMIQNTLYSALQEKALIPAGYPNIEPQPFEIGKDFSYSATFEVFPEVTIKELNKAELESIQAKVTDADVDTMITKLLESNKNWKEVTRAAKMGDKVVMDFEGFLGAEPFQGGKADKYELILGSGSMIPGFEEGIKGAKIDKPFDIEVTFPESYQSTDLAGKVARFNITVHQVFEGVLPELDDAFAKTFNIEKGGVEALKADIRQNMERELERRVKHQNRETIFDKLMEHNPLDLPKAMVDKEIEHLKHEMYHRVFGHQHHDNEKIPDFPRELFLEQANKRVHLGLLFSEYVKKHDIKADAKRTDAMIEMLASAYEAPDELKNYYRSNKERMSEIEGMVLEELVAEKIAEDATVKVKKMDYDTVMNPEQKPAKKGSKKKGE